MQWRPLNQNPVDDYPDLLFGYLGLVWLLMALGVPALKPGLPCNMGHAGVRFHVPLKTAFG